jgi:hypothetical protein
MSTTKRNRTVGLYAGCYWIGMVMTLACLTLILGGNTEALYRFEHAGFPLSWAFAAGAMLAFMTAELCHPADLVTSEQEDKNSQLTPEWDAVEGFRCEVQ